MSLPFLRNLTSLPELQFITGNLPSIQRPLHEYSFWQRSVTLLSDLSLHSQFHSAHFQTSWVPALLYLAELLNGTDPPGIFFCVKCSFPDNLYCCVLKQLITSKEAMSYGMSSCISINVNVLISLC